MGWGKNLTIDIVRRVEAELPPFALMRHVELANVSEDMRCYFSTYGFDALLEEYSSVQYSLGYLQTAHYRLAVHAWQVAEPRGTVFVTHGLFDHVGLFLSLVRRLIAANFCVVAIDFPGHGLSEGEPAVIHDFAEYAAVIDETLQAIQHDLPAPFYAVGQSTGGAALLNYVLRENFTPLFSKLVLFAPLIQPLGWRRIKVLYFFLHKFVRFVPRGFTINSHDPEFNIFLKDYDPLQPRHISTEWTGAMKNWIESFDKRPVSDLPCLIIQGDADGTVDWRANLPRLRTKFTQLDIKMVDGAMHHLTCEGDSWQSQVFARCLDFLTPS